MRFFLEDNYVVARRKYEEEKTRKKVKRMSVNNLVSLIGRPDKGHGLQTERREQCCKVLTCS